MSTVDTQLLRTGNHADSREVVPEVVSLDENSASALLFRVANGTGARRELVGFVNLKFTGREISAVSEALASPKDRDGDKRSRGRRLLAGCLSVIAVILSCIADELVFSIPVLAVATIIGPRVAFVTLTPVYFAFALGVGILVMRLQAKGRGQRDSALRRWLDRKTSRRQVSWERRALAGLGLLGAGIVTIALGPILTPWLAYRLGLGKRYDLLVAGGAFWAVCLVGTYTGLVALII
jgi:hypothetical protein